MPGDTTMAAPNGSTETITGRVESANERGIKLNGAWLNLSKWRPLPLPTRGALVSVDVKDGRFLDRIDVLDAQDMHTAAVGHTQPSSSRDAMIARQVALKAAVAYCAAREQAKAADILP